MERTIMDILFPAANPTIVRTYNPIFGSSFLVRVTNPHTGFWLMNDPDQNKGWEVYGLRFNSIKSICETYGLIVVGHYDTGNEYYRLRKRNNG